MSAFTWSQRAGLLALAAILSTPASAADLNYPPPLPPEVEERGPALLWSGLYAGLNAGYSWGRASDREASAVPYNAVNLEHFHSPADGFTGGGQIGFNYRMGHVVLGIEADFNYLNSSRSVTSPSGAVTASSNNGYIGTLRPRLGLAMGPWLLYGTGGLAYGTIDSTITGTGGNTLSATESGWRTGWVAGAGVEYALDRNWSIRTEFLHTDLGSTSVSGVALDGNTYTWNEHFRDNSIRFGINYRF